MTLTEKINEAIKKAMIAKEKEKLAALRAVKSELLILATGKGDASTDAEIKVLQKMVKQRKESAAIYIEQGREDLASDEEFQAKVISEFLPEQLSEDEIRNIINQAIEESGASSVSDMGKVMGIATAKLAGRAEGKVVAALTRSILLGE